MPAVSSLFGRVAGLDATAVNVALPAIRADLGGGLAGQQWVSNAYLLALGSLILVGGSLGDIFGERRVFSIGGHENPVAAGMPALHLEALPAPAAAELLDSRAPGLPDSVRARFLDEAAGNPLALVELPVAYRKARQRAELPLWLPLTTRLEQAFAARAFELPDQTRTALLVAALNDGFLISESLNATALLVSAAPIPDLLAPAADAGLIEADDTELRFRHPLMRAAIRQEAGISQRHAAHAALAEVLQSKPERQVWHRAAAITGPDESVARALEAAAAQAQRRGGTAVAVSALQRAASLSDGEQRPMRLLHAAELAFELGRHDLVRRLLAEAEPLGLPSGIHARLTSIRDSFGDGVPVGAASARSLTRAAERARADGDADIALKLLNGAAQRCWWTEPAQATRTRSLLPPRGLNVAESDPRLLMILAFAAPIDKGAVVLDRLSRWRRPREPAQVPTACAASRQQQSALSIWRQRRWQHR